MRHLPHWCQRAGPGPFLRLHRPSWIMLGAAQPLVIGDFFRGLKAERTVPGKYSSRNNTTPRRMAVCASCPQACIASGMVEAYGRWAICAATCYRPRRAITGLPVPIQPLLLFARHRFAARQPSPVMISATRGCGAVLLKAQLGVAVKIRRHSINCPAIFAAFQA